MFTFLAYFIVLLTLCSCQTNTPTDPTKPANISGIFYRYFPKDLKNYVDVPLQKGLDLLKDSRFDKTTTTVFYIQTWLQNANSPAPQSIAGAYLKDFHTNQVLFDWSSINTDPSYSSVAGEVEEVGAAFGKQLCELFAAGLNPDKTELIGFFIGAHVAGQAGSTTKKLCKRTLHRIVALDASASLFYFPLPIYRAIDEDDAQQTIAIHTSALQDGVFQPTAKADFYVNRGTPFQPGCGIESLGDYCNAIRSWQVYVASISQRKLFRASRANSYLEFSFQTCEENAKKEIIYMGYDTDQKLRGTFYLSTTGEAPYGKEAQGLCV